MRRFAVAVVLVLCAAAAAADSFTGITFLPRTIDSHTALTAVVSGVGNFGDACRPFNATASRDGATITIRILSAPPSTICQPAILPWTVSAFIGTLPPGTYDVITTFHENQLDRRSIVVADADAPVTVTESAGPRNAGLAVTVRLRDASRSLLNATVTFDDLPAPVINQTPIFLVVAPPPQHPAGPVTVKVTLADGTTLTAIGAFRYVDLQSPVVDRAAYEPILIPLVFAGAGAGGSQWTTELSVYNGNGFNVTQLDGPFQRYVCVVGPCLQVLPPLSVVPYDIRFSGQWPHGVIMNVARDGGAALQFGMRVRDTTRQAEALGTEIPVVRERDFRADSFWLFDVPGDARFRSKLRLYALETPPQPIFVRLLPDSGEAVIALVTLSAATRNLPAYAELDLDAMIARAGQPGPYRVFVGPTDFSGNPIYWGFVSITNNQTQHVTVVTPH